VLHVSLYDGVGSIPPLRFFHSDCDDSADSINDSEAKIDFGIDADLTDMKNPTDCNEKNRWSTKDQPLLTMFTLRPEAFAGRPPWAGLRAQGTLPSGEKNPPGVRVRRIVSIADLTQPAHCPETNK
jgi:hypothetical protein